MIQRTILTVREFPFVFECKFAIQIIRHLRIRSTSYEVKNCMLIRIRSYNSEEASQKNIIMKLYEGTIYYYIFIRQVSQMELFYLYQSKVGVQCAFPFRESLVSVLSS
jgi:hypothetical protein